MVAFSSKKITETNENISKKYKLAIFASGAGSNAAKIIDYFKNHPLISVGLIVSNKENAGVLQIAEKSGIEAYLLTSSDWKQNETYLQKLKDAKIDAVILAGFLWKLPPALVHAFPNRILNIHPALLPAYGGKGMYGGFVHEAVLQAKEKKSGITIHIVDEKYDNGEILFQASTEINESDTAESLAKKIHALEHAHFAPVIEKYLLNQ